MLAMLSEYDHLDIGRCVMLALVHDVGFFPEPFTILLMESLACRSSDRRHHTIRWRIRRRERTPGDSMLYCLLVSQKLTVPCRKRWNIS